MSIEILEIRLLEKDASLKAFIDIQVGGMVIRDFRVIKEPGKRFWVATPQNSWRDKATGKIKYKSIITFPDDLKGEIERLILNAYHLDERSKTDGKDNETELSK